MFFAQFTHNLFTRNFFLQYSSSSRSLTSLLCYFFTQIFSLLFLCPNFLLLFLCPFCLKSSWNSKQHLLWQRWNCLIHSYWLWSVRDRREEVCVIEVFLPQFTTTINHHHVKDQCQSCKNCCRKFIAFLIFSCGIMCSGSCVCHWWCIHVSSPRRIPWGN